ncbi:MAG: hypothetical protein ACNA8K_07550 [Cyclonatronaceae bacterium]
MTDSILKRKPHHPVAVVTALLLVMMFLYAFASIASDASTGQRFYYLRYFHFILSGFFAFATPHLLYPDKKLPLLRLMNPGKFSLFVMQYRKLLFWLALILTGQFLLIFFDTANPFHIGPEKIQMAGSGLFFTLSISLLSLILYARLGRQSQEWQEGKRGRRFMKTLIEQGKGTGAPAGTLPTIIVTVILTAGGMLSVVLATWLTAYTGIYLEWLAALLLLIPSLVLIGKSLTVYDRLFYQTNSFYTEIFKDPGNRGSEEWEPVPYRALYWIPETFRTAAWLSLLQFDRKLPLGRVMAVCHLVLWVLVYNDAAPTLTDMWLGGFIILQNAASYLLITPPFAPLSFQVNHFSLPGWIGARFFVNMRWFFPLVLNLLFLAWVSSAVVPADIFFWAGIHIIFAFIFSVVFTTLHELRYRRIYA